MPGFKGTLPGGRGETSQRGSNRYYNRRHGNKGQHNNRGGRHQVQHTVFKGSEKDLAGQVYDITLASRKSFALTTRTIGEYVARTFEDAGCFRRAMMDMKFVTIVAPTRPDPDSATIFDMSAYKRAMARHHK
jgi:hypothetical protein